MSWQETAFLCCCILTAGVLGALGHETIATCIVTGAFGFAVPRGMAAARRAAAAPAPEPPEAPR